MTKKTTIVRSSCFETNSSSSHCLALGKNKITVNSACLRTINNEGRLVDMSYGARNFREFNIKYNDVHSKINFLLGYVRQEFFPGLVDYNPNIAEIVEIEDAMIKALKYELDMPNLKGFGKSNPADFMRHDFHHSLVNDDFDYPLMSIFLPVNEDDLQRFLLSPESYVMVDN